MINEWVAFGIVAVVCILLGVVFRFAGFNDTLPDDRPAEDRDDAPSRH